MEQLRQGKRRMEHRSLAPDLVVSNDNDACGNQRAEELAPNVAQEELREEKQVGGPVNCSDSELSIYLQALAEGFLATYYSDTNPSVQSKLMSIASKSYQRGKKTVVFHGFPSFQMSRNSTGSRGEAGLMSSAEDSPAPTYPQREEAQVLTERNLGFGEKWPALLAKFDPVSYSWKTAQCSLFADLEQSLETWPRWGSMRNGECFQRRNSAHLTSESESGLWPTPDASCGRRGWCRVIAEQVRSGSKKRKSGATIGSCLAWEPRLLEDYRPGMRLNPDWLEWLMGWPIAHTELLPSGTDRFREWRRLHGGF